MNTRTAVLICLGVPALFLAALVGLVKFFAPSRNPHMRDVMRHYDESQKIKVPQNIDEAGIRALVGDLLPGGKDEFAERKLRLLGQRAVPALVGALSDPRFLQKPKNATQFQTSLPIDTVLGLLQPFAPLEAVAPLTPLVGSADEHVRKSAAMALGGIGTDECVWPMKNALADVSEDVRSHAMMGVERAINGKRGSPKFREAMFESIIPLLNRPGKILGNPAQTLLVVNKERAISELLEDGVMNLNNSNLVQCLGALNGAHVIIPAERLKSLMQPIGGNLENFPNKSIYGLSLIALARSGDPSVETMIQAGLDGTNKFIGDMAAEALAVKKGVAGARDKLYERMEALGIDRLTKPEQAVASVDLLIGEVENGGFDQYFFNSSGDSARYASEGLKAMGAQQTAELLRRGMGVFGAAGPSVEREKRMRQLERLSKKRRAEFSALDDVFYKDPDGLERKLWLFLAANSDAFKHDPGKEPKK